MSGSASAPSFCTLRSEVNGPMEVPGGARIAQFQDPQGGAFALYSAKGR